MGDNRQVPQEQTSEITIRHLTRYIFHNTSLSSRIHPYLKRYLVYPSISFRLHLIRFWKWIWEIWSKKAKAAGSTFNSDDPVPADILALCDFYSLGTREFFFDRSPRIFENILGLYRYYLNHAPAVVKWWFTQKRRAPPDWKCLPARLPGRAGVLGTLCSTPRLLLLMLMLMLMLMLW